MLEFESENGWCFRPSNAESFGNCSICRPVTRNIYFPVWTNKLPEVLRRFNLTLAKNITLSSFVVTELNIDSPYASKLPQYWVYGQFMYDISKVSQTLTVPSYQAALTIHRELTNTKFAIDLTDWDIVVFDIESTSPLGFPSGTSLAHQILSIGVYSKTHNLVFTRSDLPSGDPAHGWGDVEFKVITLPSEEAMLKSWWQFVDRLQYKTLLVGYNSMSYDLPFLISRSLIYQLKVPFGLTNRGYLHLTKIPHVDLLLVLKAYTSGGYDSYTLDNILKRFSLKGKDEIDYNKLPTLLTEQDVGLFRELLMYGQTDVIQTYKLAVMLLKPHLADTLNFYQISLETLMTDGKARIIAPYITLLAMKHGKMFCTRRVKNPLMNTLYGGFNWAKPYNGTVSVYDFTAFYPNIIIHWNLGQETTSIRTVANTVGLIGQFRFYAFIFTKHSNNNDLVSGKAHGLIDVSCILPQLNIKYPNMLLLIIKRDQPLTVLATVVNEHTKLRLANKYRQSNPLDFYYYNLKIVGNSMYGLLGYEKSIIFDNDTANAVTFLARGTISKLASLYRTVYVDTDSVFVSHDGNDPPQMPSTFGGIGLEYEKTGDITILGPKTYLIHDSGNKFSCRGITRHPSMLKLLDRFIIELKNIDTADSSILLFISLASTMIWNHKYIINAKVQPEYKTRTPIAQLIENRRLYGLRNINVFPLLSKNPRQLIYGIEEEFTLEKLNWLKSISPIHKPISRIISLKFNVDQKAVYSKISATIITENIKYAKKYGYNYIESNTE